METYLLLENELAEWAGYRPGQVVVCSSGTAALHLALESFGIRRGSMVLVPDYTMVACVRAVTLAGHYPVFADCDDRLLMDPALTEGYSVDREQWQRPAVTMIVHVYGRQFDVECYPRVANHYLIEDMAEAHGVSPHPDTDAACWSFYRNKIIAGEEGGAVAFKDEAQAALARQLRTLGFTDRHDFMHVPRGHNYRMSNLHAGAIRDSLQRARDATSVSNPFHVRRNLESAYDDVCPPEWRQPRRDAPWVYDVRVPGLSRARQARVVKKLNEEGIAARMGFAPMTWQAEYCDCVRVGGGNADRAAGEVFYLPLTPGAVMPADCRRSFDLIRETLEVLEIEARASDVGDVSASTTNNPT